MADNKLITVLKVNQYGVDDYTKGTLNKEQIQAFANHDHFFIKRYFPAFILKVEETEVPEKGYVYMIPGDDGKLKIHRENFDSGD